MPPFIGWKNPKGDGFEKWRYGGVLRSWRWRSREWNYFIYKRVLVELSHPFPHVRLRWKCASYKHTEGLYLTIPAPWFQTSSLLNCEEFCDVDMLPNTVLLQQPEETEKTELLTSYIYLKPWSGRNIHELNVGWGKKELKGSQYSKMRCVLSF